MQEPQETHSLGLEVPLEEEMATHSSIPAWRIPLTEEPGRLQSVRLQRLINKWASLVAQLVKNLPALQVDLGLIPGLGRCPGGEHGNPLQYSCWRIPMDRGA